MKRKLLVILLCSGLLISFTSCSNSKSEENAQSYNSSNIENNIEETTTELEELTDLPFDNSKPEYVVAYFVNKLASINADNIENLDTNDIILPSKFVNSMSSVANDFSYIAEKLIEDMQNVGVDSYSYDDFIIQLAGTPNSTSTTDTYTYCVIINVEESKFFLQIGITQADEENNHFVGYYEKQDEHLLNLLISKTEIRSFDGETSGGTKADLIKKWEDEGTLVNISLDEFM